MMKIRRAETKDIPAAMDLLSQVLAVHAEIRPDLFIPGSRKYTEAELEEIFRREDSPVFVAEAEDGRVIGYCFCQVTEESHSHALRPAKTLYIDDLCVDADSRGQHTGRALCEHALAYAREIGCTEVTLNVWEGNDSALAFYRRMGFAVRKTTMEWML